MRFTLPVAVLVSILLLVFLLSDGHFQGVGVNALVVPLMRKQNPYSVKRHSYPMQHQSLRERRSPLSHSSDWYTDSSSRYAPVSYQQEEQIISREDDVKPKPNEVLWMRQATMEDIPALQKCNRALLPENYPDRFYENYIGQYPDLAVIVESFSLEDSVEDYQNRGWYSSPLSLSSPPREKSSSSAQPVPVAYALGCIREAPSPTPAKLSPNFQQRQQPWQFQNRRSNSDPTPDDFVFYRPLVMSGHTISLAVMPTHRKMGLATKLLDYLHDSMQHRYGAVFCDLSVRMSNERAIRLYERHGYGVSERLSDYYKNGKVEDGFKMQKLLSDRSSQGTSTRIGLPQQMYVYRPQENFDSVAQW